MARPNDEEYYHEGRRTDHVSQGDIFRELQFRHPAAPEDVWFVGYGILLNYTSGVLVGAEGTNRIYRHDFRLIAPIFDLSHIHEHDDRWTYQKVQQMRSADDFGGWMYLPACVGEFNESAAALFRPELMTQEQLDDRRVAQFQLEATKHLELKLARVYAGFDAINPDDLQPDMRDHWEGAPVELN